MKVTALLPMKDHSERVPNKNMRNFVDRPLYHAVMKTLLSSEYIDKILINTDSKVIANNAIDFFNRVEIFDRPESLRGDRIPMNDIIAYDLSQLTGEHFLQTHSTNPLLTRETLERAMQEYFSILPEYDSLFSVTKNQSRFYWASGEPVNHNPKELLRTQDLLPLFEENSNIYLFSKKSFSTAGNNRIGLKPKMFVMDKAEAIDIDDKEDWKLAEALFKSRENQ